jgi:hypothetical protein
VSDWFVPGGPMIGDSGHRLHIIPPRDWVRMEINIPRVPPSMNTNQIRSNWRGFQEHKKEWQAEIEAELMIAGFPRDRYQRAMTGAWLRFEKRAKRRDTGNFTALISKAFGDALDNYRAIPDDDDVHFYFGGVEFEGLRAAERTRFVTFFQPKGAA